MNFASDAPYLTV